VNLDAHICVGVVHLMNLMELALTNQNEILPNMKARLATPAVSQQPEHQGPLKQLKRKSLHRQLKPALSSLATSIGVKVRLLLICLPNIFPTSALQRIS